MLKMVPLSKIKDNPFRDKKRNPVDKERVAQLVESIGTTGFWKGVYGREVGDLVEIAFGHTRVDAARAAGLKEIPVEIEKLTDSDMLMRMTRENLRGELLVALEAVSAAVKALGAGTVEFEDVGKDVGKAYIRYAPSFVPGKEPVTPDVTRPYTVDSLARFIGGTYIRPNGHAQELVRAALGILEMEERKVEGFSERTLKSATDSSRYLGAKQIIQLVNDVKQREVKTIERREKTAEEAAEFDRQQREIQAARKKITDEAEAARKKLVADLAKAKVEENKKKIAEIKEYIAAKEAYAVEKKLNLEVRAAELDKQVEARKAADVAQRTVDAYLPIKREAERILHKLEGDTSTTKEALAAEVKALARLALNATDRERLRQAAMTYGTWFCEYVAMLFIPPFSAKKNMDEYRKREEAQRRAAEAKAEREREKAERKSAREKKIANAKK
jgi:ParB/RepB/Spo0J family partition protein